MMSPWPKLLIAIDPGKLLEVVQRMERVVNSQGPDSAVGVFMYFVLSPFLLSLLSVESKRSALKLFSCLIASGHGGLSQSRCDKRGCVTHLAEPLPTCT